MSGMRQKHPDALVFRRGGRVKALTPVAVTEHSPELPKPEGLCDQAQQVWEETTSMAKAHLLPTDYFLLVRWITWVDLWIGEMEIVKSQGMVVETTRNAVAATTRNPRLLGIAQLERNIAQAEQAMGLTPLARMRLGITYAQEQSALQSLKAPRAKPRKLKGATTK